VIAFKFQVASKGSASASDTASSQLYAEKNAIILISTRVYIKILSSIAKAHFGEDI
jgi:hypothetical protein